MKTKILITSIFLPGALISQAQWQADMRLTNDPAVSNTSLNNAWCVASSGDTVMVVWDDQRDGNYEIYYKRDPTGNSSEINEFLIQNNSINIFPNPASNQFTIHFDSEQYNARLQIFNTMGENVYSTQILNCKSYIVNQSFPSGIYFVKVRDNKRQNL
jgi:hypothetical protein